MKLRRMRPVIHADIADGVALQPAWDTRGFHPPPTAVDCLEPLNGWTHVVLPLLLLGWATLILVGADVDRHIASWLYQMEGGRWAMKQTWWTEGLIHRLGRTLSGLATALVALAALRGFSSMRSRLHAVRWPLLRLFASVALATGMISLIKQHSGMDCPWDLAQYGGDRAYYGLFATRPAALHASGCFPAGHASAGYAWLALYFFACSVRRDWAARALAIGLAAGAVFGIGQQLRGAHFMSHDVWTAAICWFVALGVHQLRGGRRSLRKYLSRGECIDVIGRSS
jgi:membrane-associated PAP2 superfamily phosphatase